MKTSLKLLPKSLLTLEMKPLKQLLNLVGQPQLIPKKLNLISKRKMKKRTILKLLKTKKNIIFLMIPLRI